MSRGTHLLLAVLLVATGCARSEEAWIADLEDPDPFVRALGAIALSEEAPERGAVAVDVLLETIDRVDLGLQVQASRQLGRVAPYAAEELILAHFGYEFMTGDRRLAILAALTRSGPRGAESIVAAVRGSGEHVADELQIVLKSLGPLSAAPLVDLLATDPEPWRRRFAAETLAMVGGELALQGLRAAADDPDPGVRAAVDHALESLR